MPSFESSLDDEIFVDYFNTFLSLPIFPRRFLYRPRRKKFEVDPPFQDCQFNKKILFTWISSERLALFWKTDLFLDYWLCKLLISPSENDGKKQVSRMVDEKTLRKHIGHLIGMQNFRHYTKGTMGECILNFWCDAERFRRHTTPQSRRFVFREIQYKYLKNGSAYEVPDTIKWSVYGDKNKGKLVRKIGKNVSIFSEDIFVCAQKLVVDNLCNYWVPKYILHKCRELATTYQQRRLSRAIVAKHLKEFNPKLSAVHFAKIPDENVKKEEKPKKNSLIESIEEDEEYENEKNAFFETNRVSSTESDYYDAERKSANGSPFLPEIKKSNTVSSDLKEKVKSESVKLPPLSSTTSITAGEEEQIPAEGSRSNFLIRRKTRQFDIKEFLKPTKPYAMIDTADIEESQRKVKTNASLRNELEGADASGDDTVVRAVDNASATNLVQIIKPTLHEEIPKTPLSAYYCSSAGLSGPKKPKERQLFVASVTADRLAGGPFKAYLKCSGDISSLSNLQFWEDVQIYTGMANSAVVDLKFRHGRNLEVTYLQPESVREIQLEPSLRDRVCRLLRRGQADTLLLKVADQILDLLYDSWKDFVEEDLEHLREIVEMNVNARISTDEALSYLKTSQSETFRMYRALDLALCLDQGDFQPVDVEEEEEASDMEDEEEEDGSLRKRRLTIVNEEAAVALAMAAGQNMDANLRRKSHFYGKISRKPRKSSLFNSAAFKIRPPKPRKFQDILSDAVQLLWLKRFLMEHGAIIPLKFWQDVERMKTQSKDSRARQTKARVIVKSYFANTDDPSTNLQCRAEIIREIPRIEHVTPAMLVSAQACVIRSLEEQWFGRYLSTFPEDAKEEDVTKYAARNTLLGVAKIASKGKTRGLWALFGHSMMAFIRGVSKPESRKAYMEFLANECRAPAEATGRRNPNHGSRRIINNRVISVDRLINDLKFWLEVQRFKSICDGAAACAMAGNYTIDDENFIQNKARTILDCYIESLLPPKIQINITPEMAESISTLWSSGIIDRGMFHDAEIDVFCTLIHYWKKFLARGIASDAGAKEVDKRFRKKFRVERESDIKQVLYLDDMPYRRFTLAPDEEPRISFSLLFGMRVIS